MIVARAAQFVCVVRRPVTSTVNGVITAREMCHLIAAAFVLLATRTYAGRADLGS